MPARLRQARAARADRRAPRQGRAPARRGASAFPYSFPGVEPIEAVLERLRAPGGRRGDRGAPPRRRAHRGAPRRRQGRVPGPRRPQRQDPAARARRTCSASEAFERLLSLDLGDLLGVDGAALRSRHGELTLRVDRFQVLAKALRPPPDKHHGLSDVETRHRRRELDLIANEDARRLFVDRARIVSAVRAYLDARGLHRGRDAGPAAALRRRAGAPVHDPPQRAGPRPVPAHRDRAVPQAPDRRRPGARVRARQGLPQRGRLAPSTTPSSRWSSGMRPTPTTRTRPRRLEERRARRAARAVGYAGELDFERPWRRVSFFDARSPRPPASSSRALRDAGARWRRPIAERGLERADRGPPAGRRSSTTCSPSTSSRRLSQPTFVLDYPIELSPFAREHRSQPGLVERWEAFAGGHGDRQRLQRADRPRRAARALRRPAAPAGAPATQETQPYDELFLEALEQGMPPTGGVGVGIDRLVMLLTGRDSIREVVLFPAMRD